MQKRELCYEVNLSVPVVLLLEAAQDSWTKIHYFVSELIRALPGRINKMYFIGNRNAYFIGIPQHFLQNSPAWFNENKDRVMLITPIFEQLEKEFSSCMIAIICSKPPIDAMDWQGNALLDRTIFANLGDDKIFGEDYEELHNPDTSQIIDALNNPAEALYIESHDFMPLCFSADSANIEVLFDNNKFRLKLTPKSELITIHISALCKEVPKLKVKRKKGEEVYMGKEENPWFSLPNWKKVSDELKPIVSAMKQKKEFTCPQCNKLHLYNTFTCPEGDIILKDLPLNTTILLKGDNYLIISDWFAYSLSNTKVITKDSMLYDYKEDKWHFIKKINFEEIENNVFAIFHTY